MANQTVWYMNKPIGNVQIRLDADGLTGKASIDGRTRKVVYRIRTHGKLKGQLCWQCDE